MPTQTVKAPKLIARAQSAARSGDIAAAEALYRDVLARFPANRRAMDGLAKLAAARARATPKAEIDALLALWQAGRVADALARTEHLPISHPTVRDIRAAALRKLGQPAAAIPIYDDALKNDSGNAGLWFNAGSARLEDRRFAEAETCLARACAISAEPQHLLALARCKLDQGYHVEALKLADAVLTQPGTAHSHKVRALDTRGTALLRLGRTAEAMDAYGEAHALAPQDASILHDLGIAAKATGDRTAAEQALRSALAVDPERAEIHRSLSDLIRYAPDDPHLMQMETLLAKGPTPAAEADLRFALFKAMDDLDRVDAAIEHLNRGNELRRELLHYDPSQDTALFARIGTLSPPDLAATAEGPRPIFVVGLPRSGTTLTEQVLSGAPGTHPAGELPYVGQAAAALLRAAPFGPATPELMAEFAASVRGDLATHAGDDTVVIDKMPLNFRWAELILAALPEARLVWLDRDPRANAFSLYRHSFAGSGNGFAYGMEDIARMIAADRALRARVAARWPDRVHVLKLERMTSNPDPEIRALVDFCGLDWSDDCLFPEARQRTVLTASNQQVRRGIAPPARDDWARYASRLDPLERALRSHNLVA